MFLKILTLLIEIFLLVLIGVLNIAPLIFLYLASR